LEVVGLSAHDAVVFVTAKQWISPYTCEPADLESLCLSSIILKI
jgi:hypothetical protein